MELKRILARDTRSANEKAIALYGPDVLVISNHQVGGQTELVVALDVPPEAPAPQAAAAAPRSEFRAVFAQAQGGGARPLPAAEPVITADANAAAALPVAPVEATPAAAEPAEVQERDRQRGREIVDLVRDEIAALRREFRLSQQAAAWQAGVQLHPALKPLIEALDSSQVPTALRALLLDTLQGLDDAQQALSTWREQLEHNLARPQAALPIRGVHVLAGPSGGGKTLMCARLARHASGLHGSENLALISYRDQRAGAWSQTQMLGAQLGVDCFRATDEESLRLLLAELSSRTLVLIDTPGVQMTERLLEIGRIAPQAGLHAVMPADASVASLRRVLVDAGVTWHSLMPSKLDEADAAWALVQLLSNNDLQLSCASHGNRMTDLIHAYASSQLVDQVLAPLAASLAAGPQADASPAWQTGTAESSPAAHRVAHRA